MKITSIGSIDHGIDGSDEYLRVVLAEDQDVDVEAELRRMYYRDSSHPGAYFCHDVSVIASDSLAHVAIVCHRWDV